MTTRAFIPHALTPKEAKTHQAFARRPIIGYEMETFSMLHQLNHFDTIFAFGFTSYRKFVEYVQDHHDEPLDEIREILMRLYYLEPEFPRVFLAPSIQEMINFLFQFRTTSPTVLLEERKRAGALLAELLGKARSTGYRWHRAQAAPQISEVGRKMSAKLFSLYQETAREVFWRAAFAMAEARSKNTDDIKAMLRSNGVCFE
jgi:hypothetical protein